MSIKAKNSSGYTLVSVSFVLLAMSIVVTSILGFYDANNLNRRLKLTTDKFEIINTALIAYLVNNGRFPCPAPLDCDLDGCNNDGAYPEKQLGVEFRQDNDIDKDCIGDNSGVFESTNAVGEKILYGNVPTSSLGLDNNYLIDNWNNKIVYIIPKNLTEKGSARNILTDDSLPNEFVKNGEIYALFSNAINPQGAFPLKSRTSNDYSSLDTSKEENKYILPEKDFQVDFDTKRLLVFHKNKHNLHKAMDDGNIFNPDCEEINVEYVLSAENEGGGDTFCEDFSAKNQPQEFIVPDNVNQITVELWGGASRVTHDLGDSETEFYRIAGGYIKGTINTEPGTKYYLYLPTIAGTKLNYSKPYESINVQDVTKYEYFSDKISKATSLEAIDFYYDFYTGKAADIRTVKGTNWYDPKSINSRLMVAGGGGLNTIGLYLDGDSLSNISAIISTALQQPYGCGCSPDMDGEYVSDQKYPGKMCYGKGVDVFFAITIRHNSNTERYRYTTYVGGGGETIFDGTKCDLYKVKKGDYIVNGGTGYYAGCTAVFGSMLKDTNVSKDSAKTLNNITSSGILRASGGGAGFYADGIINVSGSCGANKTAAKARICYTQNTSQIVYKTFTYRKSKYGEIAFSEQICPYKVSDPIESTDYYSLSNHKDNEGKVISNKMAIRCGKNGKWESQTVNNVSELKYVYRCELLDKCSYPREINNEVTWNSNYKGVNTGIVTTSDNKKKMQCIVDDNGNAEWYNI